MFYAVTKMGVEILIRIPSFIPVKASHFLNGIQQPSLIVNQRNKQSSFFGKEILRKTGILMNIKSNKYCKYFMN